jgi:hypothetical protein
VCDGAVVCGVVSQQQTSKAQKPDLARVVPSLKNSAPAPRQQRQLCCGFAPTARVSAILLLLLPLLAAFITGLRAKNLFRIAALWRFSF